MSNVLPGDAKKSLWRMYRSRGILAGSLVGLVAAGLSAATLAPSYLVLSVSEAQTSLPATNTARSDQGDRAAIARALSEVAVLSPLISSTSTPTATMIELLAARPKGITVDHISFAAGAPGTIVLVGAADTLEHIKAYQEVLIEQKRFESVSVPVGDLAGTANGRFSITLTGNF